MCATQRPRFVDFPPIEVFLSPYIDLDIGVFHYECTNQFACNKRAIDLFCVSYPVDYPEPESIALAMKLGYKVGETPVNMLERQGGTSSIGGLSAIYYMVKVSLAIWVTCWTHSGR